MSTYWGYHCKTETCKDKITDASMMEYADQYSETWFNHGEDKLRAVYKMWPKIKELLEMDEAVYLEIEIIGTYIGNPIYWLQAHDGHEIELYNEYNKYEKI